MTFTEFITGNLPRDVQMQLRDYAANFPNVEAFYDPATAWFSTATVKATVFMLLKVFADEHYLGNWLILADQRYPSGVEKQYADVLLANPDDPTGFLLIEVTASMDLSDVLSDAAKLGGFIDANPGLSTVGYVFFVAVDTPILDQWKRAFTNYVKANFQATVIPVGIAP